MNSRPPFPLCWDNTMRSTFVECPRKFSWEYLRHFKSKSPSIHLHAGKAWAEGLEKARFAFYEAGKSPLQAQEIGQQALISAYGDFDPGKNENKSLPRLLDAFEYYFDAFPLEDDPVKPYRGPNGPMIEFSFALPLSPGLLHPETGEPLIYTGRADMIATYAGAVSIYDDKTTSSLGASWAGQWDRRSQFTGYCLKGSDEVLTQNGWVSLESLAPKTPIAQWAESGISWETPTAYHSPWFNGDMLGFEGKISLLATPDHRQVVFDKYLGECKTFKVKDLPTGNGNLRFISAGRLQSKGPSFSSPWARLLVAFQADGSWKDGDAISFHFKKARKASRLEHIFEEAGITYQKHNTLDGSFSYRINKGSEAGAFLMAHLGPEKRWGNWLLKLSGETLEEIITELPYWDGTKYTAAKAMYFSVNPENVDWIATICHLTSRHTSRHEQNGLHRLVITTGILHSVHLHRTYKEHYEGHVYCVTVPSSYFLVRSKGTIFVTGNCWAARAFGIPVTQVVVRGISILKTQINHAQALTVRTPHHVEEWHTQVIRDLRRAIECWKEGYWDVNLADACSGYGGCMFKQPCMSNDPEPWLTGGNYSVRVWNPLTREETVENPS